jgi:8-oxo-dGTP pyrophosphatase MutT (NUDIX family)
LRDKREVLMGVRSSGHAFMPNRYVFPGGAVDAGDAQAPAPVGLGSAVVDRLTQAVSVERATAIAMAAVRETWEETGLYVGHPGDSSGREIPPDWQGFYQAGLVPALDKLEYIARAITPPGLVRRFDARFFTVDASYVSGELCGNGELDHLHWVDLEEALNLKLPSITHLVLRLMQARIQNNADAFTGDPLYSQLFETALVEHYL